MYDIQLVCKYPSNFLFISIIDLNSNLTVLILILQFCVIFRITYVYMNDISLRVLIGKSIIVPFLECNSCHLWKDINTQL